MSDALRAADRSEIGRCLEQASAQLAACSRPAQGLSANCSADQLSAALSELVSVAEMFSSQPSFWLWASKAARLLGRQEDADRYSERFADRSRAL